ncbi:phytanoyl-CoA dioxygenase family protein [Paraburkholderia phymatum]|uniref:Phytanoyl-CoA dioxygenase n=1 Tax=Paraburkholderia phymatum (strain DSM 17167 / CIP 108236 / LMG 21445 / STM815) TaxID=391038 RepID=B2JIL1_PARP8|nr:phytanoyl-CoA dioxygenase family protein [Paraburkholderia phymatum]ACC72057.1 Phytanoyl-CoA dioxygenase [Paraburkholderia phymatum STM815]
MNPRTQQPVPGAHAWFREADCSVDDFATLIETSREMSVRPHFAAGLTHAIPVYDCDALRSIVSDRVRRPELLTEWASVLLDGAGVFVLQRAYEDTAAVDDATAIFESIIRHERKAGGRADHFAKAGANDRIWNAQEKLCLAAPDVFVRYFANPVLMAAAEAWLGPGYQMTSQVNVVRPGGEAQQAHRDFHLGFVTVDEAQRVPPHVHAMSALLTLQGAVAHTDMPVESGPTKLLPFSQRYPQGYVAWRREDFRAYFEAHYAQLPLQKGDALFFNPALFHAAGSNRTQDVQRMANLLQVSSAYGRAMESLDRTRMCIAAYPVLRAMQAQRTLDPEQLAAVLASCADGYAFPTNLDRNPPVGGLAPANQQQIFARALSEDWPDEQFAAALHDLEFRNATH